MATKSERLQKISALDFVRGGEIRGHASDFRRIRKMDLLGAAPRRESRSKDQRKRFAPKHRKPSEDSLESAQRLPLWPRSLLLPPSPASSSRTHRPIRGARQPLLEPRHHDGVDHVGRRAVE